MKEAISKHSMSKDHQTKALVNVQKKLIFIDCCELSIVQTLYIKHPT